MGATSDQPSDRQTEALVALYETEISANIGELQATTTIVLGLLAYLAATLFAIDSIQNPKLLPLLPLGVLFGCTYQLLRAAVALRRASLAREYEGRLVEIAGYSTQAFQDGQVGSPFYGQLDDIGVLLKKRPAGWLGKFIVAVVAYAGLYLLAIAYTVVVLCEMTNRGDYGWYSGAWILGYIVAWVSLGVGARYLFAAAQPATPDET